MASLMASKVSTARRNFDGCRDTDILQGLSITCGGGDACIYNSIASKIGCCPLSSTACPIATTCLDSSQSALFTTDNGLTIFW